PALKVRPGEAPDTGPVRNWVSVLDLPSSSPIPSLPSTGNAGAQPPDTGPVDLLTFDQAVLPHLTGDPVLLEALHQAQAFGSGALSNRTDWWLDGAPLDQFFVFGIIQRWGEHLPDACCIIQVPQAMYRVIWDDEVEPLTDDHLLPIVGDLVLMNVRMGLAPPRDGYPFTDSRTKFQWQHLLMSNVRVVAHHWQQDVILQYMHQFTLLAVDAENNRKWTAYQTRMDALHTADANSNRKKYRNYLWEHELDMVHVVDAVPVPQVYTEIVRASI
ncbi:hypothetical protein FOMPIDRAFT_1056885, partial [Fomitopsis schrenkii]